MQKTVNSSKPGKPESGGAVLIYAERPIGVAGLALLKLKKHPDSPLAQGETVEELSTEKSWSNIEFQRGLGAKQTGWVNSDALRDFEPEMVPIDLNTFAETVMSAARNEKTNPSFHHRYPRACRSTQEQKYARRSYQQSLSRILLLSHHHRSRRF